MATRNEKSILDRMKLIDEYVGAIVSNDVQGIIMIDNFSQLNNESVENIYRFLRRHGGTAGRVSNPRVKVSVTAESNLQVMIYYTHNFKRMGAHAHMPMSSYPRSAQFITSRTWKKNIRTQKFYLPYILRTVPRHWKRWRST